MNPSQVSHFSIELYRIVVFLIILLSFLKLIRTYIISWNFIFNITV